MSSAAITQIAFPTLDDRQMELVGAIGELVQFADNEELILQGQKDYPFYVIKSGEVRVPYCRRLRILRHAVSVIYGHC